MGVPDRGKKYARTRYAVFFADFALTVVFLSVAQGSGFSSFLKGLALSIAPSYHASVLVYLILFSICQYLLFLPQGFYSGFIVEHRFGLSRQSLRDWMREEAKKALVSFVVFAIVMEAFYTVLKLFPHAWWAVAAIAWFFFSAFLSLVFPVIVIPLFYKYKRIEDPALRERILDLTTKAKIGVTDVFEIDFSKNTRKSNAAFAGWGRTRRIILADNLLKEFTQDEIAVVVAHEIAHGKAHHAWKLIGLSFLTSLISFFIFHLISPQVIGLFSVEGLWDISIFPALALAFTLLNFLLLPVHNGYSRVLEEEADLFALKLTRLTEAFISLMEKFAVKNLADTDPNRVIELVLYNHPSISRRIESARSFREDASGRA